MEETVRFLECKSGGGSGVCGRSIWVETSSVIAIRVVGRESIVVLTGGYEVGIDEPADSFLKRLEAAR